MKCQVCQPEAAPSHRAGCERARYRWVVVLAERMAYRGPPRVRAGWKGRHTAGGHSQCYSTVRSRLAEMALHLEGTPSVQA